MATIQFSEESLLVAIRRSIESEVQRVIGEEAALAAVRVEERVRHEVGGIALRILDSYRVSLSGRDELHIVVKHEGLV